MEDWEYRREELENERAMLKIRFRGREPSDDDVKWSILNKDIVRCIASRWWVRYRSVLFEMAEISRRRSKLGAAFDLYLDVSYLDWNGVRSTGITDPKEWKKYPILSGPFNPIKQSFGPYISNIKSTCLTLGITIDELEALFIQRAGQVQGICEAPVSPSECWVELKKAIAHVDELDQRKAECPSCHQALKKIPGSKTKCPHCGEYMYVRTRPQDRTRVIVNKAGADKLAVEWAAYFEERENKEIVAIQEEMAKIAHDGLKTWKEMGVKAFKCYAAPVGDVCAECRKRDGMVVDVNDVEIGKNLPPFSTCLNTNKKQCGRIGCRCYWEVVYERQPLV
jgi:predicted RNA-binding Zn-ribbon protein involved in translation (DUF1610 family)